MPTIHRTSSTSLTSRIYWGILLRGIFLIIFGGIAVIWPAITLISLSILFSVYILMSGIVNVVFGVLDFEQTRRSIVHFLLGILEIGVGIYALHSPALSLSAFVLLLGLLLIMRGLFEIFLSPLISWFSTKGAILHSIVGILGVIAGLTILYYPVSGGLAFIWVLGFYAMMAGAILLALGIEFHAWTHKKGQLV